MDIKALILKIASEKGKVKTSDIVRELHNAKSRQYISSIMRMMVNKKLLLKGGNTAGSFYILPQNISLLGDEVTVKLKRKDLEEHKVFNDLKEKAPFMGFSSAFNANSPRINFLLGANLVCSVANK